MQTPKLRYRWDFEIRPDSFPGRLHKAITGMNALGVPDPRLPTGPPTFGAGTENPNAAFLRHGQALGERILTKISASRTEARPDHNLPRFGLYVIYYVPPGIWRDPNEFTFHTRVETSIPVFEIETRVQARNHTEVVMVCLEPAFADAMRELIDRIIWVVDDYRRAPALPAARDREVIASSEGASVRRARLESRLLARMEREEAVRREQADSARTFEIDASVEVFEGVLNAFTRLPEYGTYGTANGHFVVSGLRKTAVLNEGGGVLQIVGDGSSRDRMVWFTFTCLPLGYNRMSVTACCNEPAFRAMYDRLLAQIGEKYPESGLAVAPARDADPGRGNATGAGRTRRKRPGQPRLAANDWAYQESLRGRSPTELLDEWLTRGGCKNCTEFSVKLDVLKKAIAYRKKHPETIKKESP